MSTEKIGTPKSAAPRAPGLRSMTGFAQARADQDGWALRLSVRSVNHRFLDLHVRLPEGYEVIEPRVRQMVREHVRRGHVDVTLRIDPAGPAAVQVNHELAEAYARAAQDLARKFAANALPDFISILRLPGVIAGPGIGKEEEQARVHMHAVACLDEALGRLDEMRSAEGLALAHDMRGRLTRIGEHAAVIERFAEQLRPAFAKRLELRLKEILGSAPLDPARLSQEAAMLAERSDISEEVARLRSHLQQFEKLLGSGSEAGKKLDFLLQEMQREANTMLSKTPGVDAEGLAITEVALEVKAEIERLREQIQNVE
jgi:uncharacterized protein (TIGR00255 family)